MSYTSNLETLRTSTKNQWKFQLTPKIVKYNNVKLIAFFKNVYKLLLYHKIYFVTIGISQDLKIYIYVYILNSFKNKQYKNFLKFILLYLALYFKNLVFNLKFINITKFVNRKGILNLTKRILRIIKPNYREKLRIKFHKAIKSILLGMFFCNTYIIMHGIKYILEKAPYKRQWKPIFHIKKILFLVYRSKKLFKGLNLHISGKINGRKRTIKMRWHLGKVNKATFNHIILFDQISCCTYYGSIGVNFWLFITNRKQKCTTRLYI